VDGSCHRSPRSSIGGRDGASGRARTAGAGVWARPPRVPGYRHRQAARRPRPSRSRCRSSCTATTGSTRRSTAPTDLAARHTEVGLGVYIGCRISIVDRFYATPWIGVGYRFGAKDATLAGATYKSTSLNIFPAVHLGYPFV